MLDAIKQLLDSNVITEGTHDSIMEAWEEKLKETKEVLRNELREEFAQRHRHDKKVMVEALNKMVTEGLEAEIQEFMEDKKALAEDRVKFNKSMQETAAQFNNFLMTKLAEEIKDFRKDRENYMEGLKAVESFVAKKLAEEVSEFAQDKQAVVETKVKLVKEARKQLDNLKTRFIKESAEKVSNHVKSKLTSELTALREDIEISRQNNFGRRIFETFGSEFMTNFLNENAEIRKLKGKIDEMGKQLAESKQNQNKLKKLTESKDREIRIIKEGNKRDDVLKELLSPLNQDNKRVMRDLLENVQTDRLVSSYEKYLPAVLSKTAKATDKKVVTESHKAVTGDKQAKSPENNNSSDILDFQKLAGVKKV